MLATLLLGCSPKNYQSMRWSNTPIKPDGETEEWGDFLRYYDKDSKLFYELGNDSSNLYFAARTNDDMTKQKIQQKGLELGFTPEGEKNYPVRIRFPYHGPYRTPQGRERPRSNENERPSQRGERPNFPPAQMHEKQMPMQIYVTGFYSNIKDSVLSIDNPYGIEANISMKDSNLCLEAKIPLVTFLKEKLAAADTLHPYEFQILLSAIAPPTHKFSNRPENGQPGSPPKRMGGPGGPGGGTPPSGKSFGGPPDQEKGKGSQMNDQQTSSKKTEIQFVMRFSMR